MQSKTIVIGLPNVSVKSDNFIDDQEKSINSNLSLIEKLIKNAIYSYSNKFKIEYKPLNEQMEIRIVNEQDDWIGEDMNLLIMDEIRNHLAVVEQFEEHIVNDELDKAAALNKEHKNKLKSSYDTMARLKDEVNLVCDDKKVKVQNKQKLSHESQTETIKYVWPQVEINRPELRECNTAEFVTHCENGSENVAELHISKELWPKVFRLICERKKVEIEFEKPLATISSKKLTGNLLRIVECHDLLDEED